MSKYLVCIAMLWALFSAVNVLHSKPSKDRYPPFEIEKAEPFPEVLEFESNEEPELHFVPIEEVKASDPTKIRKNKFDDPDKAWEYNFNMTVDPNLGYVPHERRDAAMRYAERLYRENWRKSKNEDSPQTAVGGIYWQERGPSNVGGRTRALMWDPTVDSPTKVWSGGVSGGLWYNNNITNSSSSWQKVDDFWDNLAIACITYDPSNTSAFYVGTGEGWYNGDAVRGDGIWKTTDAGSSWFQLNATDNNPAFWSVSDIVVLSTGTVIAACEGGIYRSTNGGTSFTQMISGYFADLEKDGSDNVYAASGRYQTSATSRTGYLYKSTNDGVNWSDITPLAGTYPYHQRCEVAVGYDNNRVYFISSNTLNAYCLARSANGGSSWTDLTSTIPVYRNQNCTLSSYDFARWQAWYNLILRVNPSDVNEVLLGGIDVYRTTDGGLNWGLISYWTGFCNDYVHADIHAFEFRPGSSTEIVVGTDGGVFYCADITAVNPDFDARNKDYNTVQFYTCAMTHNSGSDYFLGGTQDNGTQEFDSPGIDMTSTVIGGDGAFCWISQIDTNYKIGSYTYQNYYRTTTFNGAFSSISSRSNYGQFINPADFDEDGNDLSSPYNPDGVLHCGDNVDELAFVCPIRYGTPTLWFYGWVGMLNGGKATAVKVSPYAPNRIFVGTDIGGIFLVDDATWYPGTPVFINIDPNNQLPAGPFHNISCIDVGASDNELLVTFSNYGVPHVMYTSNLGISWTSVWGNLPDIPVRWGIFNPLDRNQVFLATEAGVWSTTSLSAPVDWSPTSDLMASVRCDMIRYRPSDQLLLVGTHGRGFYTSDALGCPTSRTLQNITIDNGESTQLKATGTITTAGTGTAFDVETGCTADLVAGTSVTLLPGTHAQSGCSFRARTDVSPCSPSPAPPPPEPDFEPTDVAEDQLAFPEVAVFPNPSCGKFFVSYRGEEKIRSIRILNAFAGSAYDSFHPVGTINEINLQHAESGLYFVEVETESQKYVEKVMITK